MWPKQLSFYMLSAEELGKLTADSLNDALGKRPFQPCMGLDWYSEGWTAPAQHADRMVLISQGENWMIRLRREDKILPGSVIRDFVDTKVKEIEDKELRKVGRKERLAIKEQVTDDLLPRSYVKSSSLAAWIDTKAQTIMVCTSTASKSEALVSKLRETLPPFPAALPRTKIAPYTAMTDWLAAGEAPQGFELDADAVLKEGSDSGGQIKISRHDLTVEEIRKHIAAGKQVTTLGLIWNEKIRFLLTESLRLKRIQFLDVLQEEASQNADDLPSLLDATFMLMSTELRFLVEMLIDALGGIETDNK